METLKELFEIGEDRNVRIEGKVYKYPSSINGIRVVYRVDSGNRTLWIANIVGITPWAKHNQIIITNTLLQRHNYNRVMKTCLHEFFHFIQHLHMNENELETQKEMFERLNEKGFVSDYSSTQPMEYGAETFAYWYALSHLGMEIPKDKQWNKWIAVDYVYLFDRVKRYKNNLRI